MPLRKEDICLCDRSNGFETYALIQEAADYSQSSKNKYHGVKISVAEREQQNKSRALKIMFGTDTQKEMENTFSKDKQDIGDRSCI